MSDRTAAFGACPGCTGNKVGLVRMGLHLLWKGHNKVTWSGTRLQCRVVGQRLCEQPARDVTSLTGTPTPTCSHEETQWT